MDLKSISKVSLGLGILSWGWNLFGPYEQGDSRFFTDFKFSDLYVFEVLQAMIFIVSGLLFMLKKNSIRIWWFEIGMLTAFLAEFLIGIFSYPFPDNLPSSLGYLFFVTHFALQGNPLRKLEKGNLPIDRISALVGFIPLATLIIGWTMPFEKSVYKLVGDKVFAASGEKTSISTCCSISEMSIENNISDISVYISTILFLILVFIGMRVSQVVFIPLLLPSFQSAVHWLSGLGPQNIEPSESWTQADIDTYHLTLNIFGLAGGYIFSFALIALTIVLMLPTAIRGMARNQEPRD